MTFFDVLMFIMTFFIAWGVLRSIKAQNRFAVVFGLISLALFLYADYLIFKLKVFV
jgi:hypothetical protein